MINTAEYELLKEEIKLGYKWVARDSDNALYVYTSAPIKHSSDWNVDVQSRLDTIGRYDEEILSCVAWEDEYPTLIADLIDAYEAHQELEVKIPEFVAEWVEKCKAGEGSSALTNLFRTPRKIDEWLEKSNSNYDLIYSAYFNGYELLEETYYAKIKGWDKVKTTHNVPSPNIYWNYYEPKGLLVLANKRNGDAYQTIATIARWNELGIDQSNAVFEKA